ncbi:Alpha/Beta hydrolase protein [Piptocephalis cylindrospora]|uniref:triacylglycerol lipase n=1 Tax=Piptocephalis cylindrospora TaxID=1907219 RepID=A0A4P9Y1F7_9FUNG|nr:Alpha/Beta hydrolase protein [Piptocephalis cylindrospora]|eukprot:RKP12617.1 Alpha/Beta hydrolase protein [Piptocephalis cylindrospora]
MTYDAYIDPSKADWYEMEGPWANGTLIPFGWEEDGLRGYVFGDEANTTFVITVKGTSSASFWGGNSETAARDKIQDNILFSCCCARVDYTWSTVCPCYMKGNQCNQTCLEDSVDLEDSYYLAATSIYLTLAKEYPDAAIWFNGHSLGGSIVGLLALTFGVPSVSFEAPGDMLPARRLHLPMPPGVDWKDMAIWHIGHNADPLFLGTCVGPSSSCWYAGFAMESKCHVGRVCMFDVAERLGWKQDVRTHRIGEVIEKVLIPWEGDYPECVPQEPCSDCGLWDFREVDA